MPTLDTPQHSYVHMGGAAPHGRRFQWLHRRLPGDGGASDIGGKAHGSKAKARGPSMTLRITSIILLSLLIVVAFIILTAMVCMNTDCGPSAGRVLEYLPPLQGPLTGRGKASPSPPSEVHLGPPIPRTLHMSYIPDKAALEAVAFSPKNSTFRSHWLHSCLTHNPGYQLMFWGEAEGERLLRDHYPEYEPAWRNLSSAILKADALRIFVLHHHGGVYLDCDTECFGPLDSSLHGAQLVLPAELEDRLVNSQMASVAGHPFWKGMMQQLNISASAGETNPLLAMGPMATTAVFKAYLNLTGTVRVTGEWLDHTYQPEGKPTHVRVYPIGGPWFMPCSWNNQTCHMDLASSKAVVRQLAHGLQLPPQEHLPLPAQHLVTSAAAFSSAIGTHHFSGSWTGWADRVDGSLLNHRAMAGASGLHTFFSSQALFEEHHLWPGGGCGDSPAAQHLRLQGLCMSIMERAASMFNDASMAPGCRVLSFRTRGHDLSSSFEAELAGVCGKITIVDGRLASAASNKQGQPQGVSAEGVQMGQQQEVPSNVHYVHGAQLGPRLDPFSFPPTYPLETLARDVHDEERITLLSLACGEECDVWEVLNELHLREGAGSLLDRVDTLLLQLPALPTSRRHMLNTLYAMLYQYHGFVGYFWREDWTEGSEGVGPDGAPYFMKPLTLGFARVPQARGPAWGSVQA